MCAIGGGLYGAQFVRLVHLIGTSPDLSPLALALLVAFLALAAIH